MTIEKVSIKNFRNIEALRIAFHPSLTIIYGDNAQGKTNILEAVYICGTGRSKRAKNDKEMIMDGKTEAHIQSTLLHRESRRDTIDVHLKSDTKKGIAINGVPIKKLGDLFGFFYVVMFAPEDLQIIKEGPAERRKFIDLELCQLSKLYYYDLQQYYKALKQRNHLLKKIQTKHSDKQSLFIWDKQVIGYGIQIMRQRSAFIEKINTIANRKHQWMTAEKENLTITYKKSVLENEYEKKLEKNVERDIFLGSTAYGPHKDDINFFINGKDVKIFGSQGQKRLAALSLKLAEIDLIKEETHEPPVLLLDDVLSELDAKRQFYLLEHIKDVQTILTCTGMEDSMKKILENGLFIKVKNGKIER